MRYPTTTLTFGLANGHFSTLTHSRDLQPAPLNNAVLCDMKLVLGRATAWSDQALQLNLAATRILETNNCFTLAHARGEHMTIAVSSASFEGG